MLPYIKIEPRHLAACSMYFRELMLPDAATSARKTLQARRPVDAPARARDRRRHHTCALVQDYKPTSCGAAATSSQEQTLGIEENSSIFLGPRSC